MHDKDEFSSLVNVNVGSRVPLRVWKGLKRQGFVRLTRAKGQKRKVGVLTKSGRNRMYRLEMELGFD